MKRGRLGGRNIERDSKELRRLLYQASLVLQQLRVRNALQIDDQNVLGFLNAAASGYLFTVSTTATGELLLTDQGSQNSYRIRTTLNGGAVADLLWAENVADESLLSLGLGPQGGRLVLGSEVVLAAKGASGGNTLFGLGIANPAEKLHVYGGAIKAEGAGVLGGQLILQNDPATPADNDVAGNVRAFGKNDAGNPVIIGEIYFQISDVSENLEDSSIHFVTQLDRVDQFVMSLVANKVGVRTLAPQRTLHVVGTDGAVDSFPGSVATRSEFLLENNNNVFLGLVSDVSSLAGLRCYEDGQAGVQGFLHYDHANDEWIFAVGASGTARMRIATGVQVGAPTGGDKGAGTINAQAVYDDNALLTPYVLEAARHGRIDLDALDAKVPNRIIPPKMRLVPAVTRKIPARTMRLDRGKDPITRKPLPPKYVQMPESIEVIEPEREEIAEPARIEERVHDPARRFAASLEEELDPVRYAAKWRRLGHLPAFPSEQEWVKKGNFSIGDLLQRCMETIEVQAVHIDKQQQQIAALVERVAALESNRAT